MNWKHVCLTGSLATALLFTACDKDNDENDVNAQDDTFISAASKSNRAEMELGLMAQQKGTASSVKMYALMMVEDHAVSQAELQSVVDNVDTEANMNDSLDADQIAMRTMLSSLPAGPTFDSAYIAGQISGHQKTIGVFNAEIAGGQNARVKSFASAKLPVVQMHKAMADSIYLLVN